MKILITGAEGFIGKNLLADLKNIQCGKKKSSLKELELFYFEKGDTQKTLASYCKDCDVVVHLAGVNRPKEEAEFQEGNADLTKTVLDALLLAKNPATVILSSSTQAALDNPYGFSKRQAEDAVFAYAEASGAKVCVYRLPNVFGKWSKPNYNSAIATFCYNISRGMPITVNNRKVDLRLVYIDDVIEEFLRAIEGQPTRDGMYCVVPIVYEQKLGDIVDLLYGFHAMRSDLSVPNVAEPFEKKLYATYLSFLDVDNLSYPLKMNVDHRGSFTEIIRTAGAGQFSVNISRPHITKGNHWHHTKNEKFLVVSGQGVIRFRKLGEEKIKEYYVSGDKLEVIDIPVGYTHNIENLGESDMVTFMWCNECFDPNHPDTFFEEV